MLSTKSVSPSTVAYVSKYDGDAKMGLDLRTLQNFLPLIWEIGWFKNLNREGGKTFSGIFEDAPGCCA